MLALADRQTFDLYSIQILSDLKKHVAIYRFYFVSFFSCFSFVTFNRQTSYEAGILRQLYVFIRGLPVYNIEVFRLAGLITAVDRTVRALNALVAG